MVYAYTAIEEQELRWVVSNQDKLCTEIYIGLKDALSRGDRDANRLGKRMSLPSSHTGGCWSKVQNYKGTIAISW